MKEIIMNLLRDENGQGMAEYGLILALIAAVCIVAFKTLGSSINTKMGDVNQQLQ